MRATKLLIIFLATILLHQYAMVEARKSGRSSKSKSKSSGNSASKSSSNSWGSSSSSSSSKKSNTKNTLTKIKTKAINDKKTNSHKLTKDKFRKQKKITQVDRGFGKAVMRSDRAGGRLIVQRRGQVFFLRIRDITERSSNGTEVILFAFKHFHSYIS